jgi:hypothetical protein
VSASAQEQDAALLADVASDHFNDVIDFQAKCRDVTPFRQRREVAAVAPRRITRGNPLRASTVTLAMSRPLEVRGRRCRHTA